MIENEYDYHYDLMIGYSFNATKKQAPFTCYCYKIIYIM